MAVTSSRRSRRRTNVRIILAGTVGAALLLGTLSVPPAEASTTVRRDLATSAAVRSAAPSASAARQPVRVSGSATARWRKAQKLFAPLLTDLRSRSHKKARHLSTTDLAHAVAPAAVSGYSHSVDFSEIPTGSTVTDASFVAEGLDLGSMNQVTTINNDGSLGATTGQAYTTTNAAYPGNGPFVVAPVGNSGVVLEPNSEGVEFGFVGPNSTSLPVRAAGFDLIPYDWQNLSGPITVDWADLQYVQSMGRNGHLVQTSYAPSDGSIIHVSSPAGGDWLVGGAYASNLTAAVFGVDNVGWTTYKTPTASQQGHAWNPAVRRTTCPGADPVDCATGAFNDSAVDVSIPGRGAGLSQSRSYNSQSVGTDGRVASLIVV